MEEKLWKADGQDDVEAVDHPLCHRIFHDFNPPSPEQRGSWEAGKPASYLHNELRTCRLRWQGDNTRR